MNQILSAGQAAASSSFLQGFSIIRITDKEKREKFSVLANNQNFIKNAPEEVVISTKNELMNIQKEIFEINKSMENL